MSMPAGTRVGPYEIIAAIGAGGMGEVYRAHDPRLGRDVVIKVPATFSADPDRLRRFEHEARMPRPQEAAAQAASVNLRLSVLPGAVSP